MVLTYSSYGKDDNKVKSYYYKCNKKYTMYNCSNCNINGKEIENFVLDKIKVTDKDVLIDEYKKLRSGFKSIKPKSNIDIQVDIDNKEKAIEQLVIQLSEVSSGPDSKYIIAQIDKLGLDVESLKKKMDVVNDVSNDIEVKMLNIDLIVEDLNKFNKCIDEGSVEEKKLLLSFVVDRITWDGDLGEVRIFYHGLEWVQFEDNSLCLDTDGFSVPYIKT